MGKPQIKLAYDCLIWFNGETINFKADNGDELKVWGLCFSKELAHKDDLFCGLLKFYQAYLQASSIVQVKGGQIAPDFWELPSGNKITLQIRLFVV